MKTAFSIIGAIIVIALFGTMLLGINEAQTDERTDSFGAVVTGGGVFDADVVLLGDLYDDSNLNVVSITSTLGTDVPLSGVYTAVTNTLNITGLTASQTRTLAVTYKIDALTNYAAVGSFFGFTPLLIGVAIVIIIVAALVAAFRRGN